MSFLLGAFTAVGVFYVVRNRRNHRNHRSPRRFGPGAAMHRRWTRRWRSRGVERVADWIDASPAQARVLSEEADGLFDTARGVRGGASLRGVFAEALRGEAFDKAAVEGALDARAEAMQGLKARALAAVERLRGSLDDEQRGELASLLENGPRGCCHGAAQS